MEMINHCTSEGKPMTSSQVFNRATNRAICFRASKGTWAHLKKLALGWGRNPLFPYGHPTWSMSTSGTSRGSKQDERAAGCTRAEVWLFLLAAGVEVQDRELSCLSPKGQDTPAPWQQESVTAFRHSPRQETALDGTRNWKVKSKQLGISDFAKHGQDCRAHYFLISHRNSRTTMVNTTL